MHIPVQKVVVDNCMGFVFYKVVHSSFLSHWQRHHSNGTHGHQTGHDSCAVVVAQVGHASLCEIGSFSC
jgi:hypothetical protein